MYGDLGKPLMKRRKGFGKINIDGKIFQFNWADTPNGPTLVMYGEDDKKIEIPYDIWRFYSESDEYRSGLQKYGEWFLHTWHGKHKKGPEWGGWGKREARELYSKYLKHIKE